ncbi:MAG: YncE family protein, partial [Mycobacterium sp.]
MTLFVRYASGDGDAVGHDRELSPSGKRRWLAPGRVVTGVLAVIGAVVLAVFLCGCGGPSADRASTSSSSSAAPSSGEAGPAGQGQYRVTATVPVEGGVFDLAVDPSTRTVYVTGLPDAVSVIDGATRTVTATVPVEGGAFDLAVDPDTNTVYATGDENTVSVIDGATRTVTGTVPVGEGPLDLAVDSGTRTVYVTTGRRCANRGFCYGDGTVSVIDGATRTVTGT